MRMRRRHLVASGAICSLIVVAPGLIVANRALDTRPVCQRVDEWFDNHRHALSSRYEDVAALPIDYRRRAVARMPERIRRDLFAIHFNRIANEERLTPEQRVWLRTEARHASEMATNQHAPTSEELFRVFGGNRELIRAIVNLGDDGGSFRTPQSTMLALEHLFRVRLLAQPVQCGCSVEQDWCNVHNSNPDIFIWCSYALDDCVETQSGCGWLWSLPCNGRCLICPFPFTDHELCPPPGFGPQSESSQQVFDARESPGLVR
jgi:hypothetical protein